MASLLELLFYWSVGMLHLKESDVVAPALSLRGPLRNYPSSEALHQPCSWCWAAIRPFTLSSDSNFTSSFSHHCTNLMGCPLPREKWGEKERSEKEAERKGNGRVIKRHPPSTCSNTTWSPKRVSNREGKKEKRGRNGGRMKDERLGGRDGSKKMADKLNLAFTASHLHMIIIVTLSPQWPIAPVIHSNSHRKS